MEVTISASSPSLVALVQEPEAIQHTQQLVIHIRPCNLNSDEMRQAVNILRQMKSLRKLEFHYRVGSPIVDFIKQVSLSNSSQLQVFHLQPQPREGPNDWKQSDISAVPIFELSDLPDAEELYLHGLEILSRSTADDFGRSFQAQRMTLKACQVQAQDLGHLLSHFPNLTSLDCEILIDAEKVRGWFDLTKTKEGLVNIQAKLKHLTISFELATSTAIDTGNEGAWGIHSSLGSLESFSQLQSLEASFVTLLGWQASQARNLSDILPVGLQKLTIRRDEALWWGYQWDEGFASGMIKTMLQQFTAKRQGHLRELVVHMPEDMPRLETDLVSTRNIEVTIVVDDF